MMRDKKAHCDLMARVMHINLDQNKCIQEFEKLKLHCVVHQSSLILIQGWSPVRELPNWHIIFKQG